MTASSTTLTAAFAEVPSDARGHLGLLFYAAVFHIIYCLRGRATDNEHPLEEVFKKYPFLSTYFAQIRERLPENIDWDESLDWLRDQILTWEKSSPDPLPLASMREGLGLEYHSLLAFILAGMVEEQGEFGALFAVLGNPRGEHRVSLGCMQQLLESEASVEAWQFIRPLVECGFLQVINHEAPRSEWILRVPNVLWNAVRGECPERPLDQVRYHAPHSFESLSEIIIDEGARRRLTELKDMANAGQTRALIVRGMPGTDRLGAIGALARGLNRGVLEIECSLPVHSQEDRWRLIGPLCTLTHALPVFSVEAGPGETFVAPAIGGYLGPIAVMIGREGGVAGPHAERSVTLSFDLESPAHRREIWARAFEGQASEAARSPQLIDAASDFCLPGRHIRQCAELAVGYAAIDGRRDVTMADVRVAARAMNRQILDTLAARVEGDASWSQLIVREATSSELQLLEARCRRREQLAATFQGSMPGGLNRGVRALFEGPSGTGKTLAARVLSTELGLDLYRVDLSAVVNKYIGETEKNLSRVLGRAEDLNVILLLDEGDSLMTRRTDVQSSNDRHANLETNYLLQRLEHYAGIVLITTNAGQSIDSAFRRRMDAVVKFHLPDPLERWRLWQVHLPAGHIVTSEALEEIALRYELTGGQIRNVCVNAALAMLSDTNLALALPELKAALQAEHRKAGSSFIDSVSTGRPGRRSAMATFLGGLS